MNEEEKDGWPRLTEEVVNLLPENERPLIRKHEEQTINGNKMQLEDICKNCHVRPQFAKTYRVLKKDLKKHLDTLRAGLAVKNPQFSDSFLMAMINSTDNIVSHKLSLMAQHFELRWGEAIENWAGKEGEGLGCSIIIFMITTGISAAAIYVTMVINK